MRKRSCKLQTGIVSLLGFFAWCQSVFVCFVLSRQPECIACFAGWFFHACYVLCFGWQVVNRFMTSLSRYTPFFCLFVNKQAWAAVCHRLSPEFFTLYAVRVKNALLANSMCLAIAMVGRDLLQCAVSKCVRTVYVVMWFSLVQQQMLLHWPPSCWQAIIRAWACRSKLSCIMCMWMRVCLSQLRCCLAHPSAVFPHV